MKDTLNPNEWIVNFIRYPGLRIQAALCCGSIIYEVSGGIPEEYQVDEMLPFSIDRSEWYGTFGMMTLWDDTIEWYETWWEQGTIEKIELNGYEFVLVRASETPQET